MSANYQYTIGRGEQDTASPLLAPRIASLCHGKSWQSVRTIGITIFPPMSPSEQASIDAFLSYHSALAVQYHKSWMAKHSVEMLEEHDNDMANISKGCSQMEIGDRCYESYPCQHRVTLYYTETVHKPTLQRLMGARDITRLCADLGMEIPGHFKEYQ